MLSPGDNIARGGCEVAITAPQGEGIAAHIETLHLPQQISSHCSSWLQLRSESEVGWVRIKSFSEKICGSFDQQTGNIGDDRTAWEPRHQFYNETVSNQITIIFNRGNYQVSQLMFRIVVTPLALQCGGGDENHHPMFKCGGGAQDYCIDTSLVCDGRVNCMLPGREAVDESNILCKNISETGRNNDNNVVKSDTGT